MSARDLSIEDLEGLLHTHSQKFANAQFAELDKWEPCSPLADALLTVGVFLLWVAAPAIVLCFFALS
jgi:hypothetical protein